MSTIDEVKQKIDIVDVINQYTTLTKSGRTFRGLCPFHSEKRPSFFVYPEQQTWHCFGACNTGGDVFSFIMKKDGTDFGETLRLLAQRAGVTLPSKPEQDGRKDEREKLFQINGAAAQYFHNLLLNSQAGGKARDYLAKRGISPETIASFQLGFSLDNWESLKQYLLGKDYAESEILEAGLIVETDAGKTHDRFRNRLVFPINDTRGRVTGFGARVLDDSLPKYLNSPQTPVFDKSGGLYSINLAAPAIRQQNTAVIVEGYMDVITAHQSGFTNVVAAMGTSVTERQITTIKRLSRNMALALDADAAGEEAMLRCVGYENSLDAQVKIIVLPSGKDPDDVIREDTSTWQHLLDNALPAIDYTFNMVTAKLDLTTAQDKSLAVDRLLPLIAEIKDAVRQDHYLNKLAGLTGTNYRRLETALSRIKSERRAERPKSKAVTKTVQSIYSSPPEEYCLALLLRYHELKSLNKSLLPEYFNNTQNREIFIGWQEVDDLPSLKDRLDTTIWEHLDTLISKDIPGNQIEQKFTDSVLNLKKKYLQDMAAKEAQALGLEAESGGSAAELAKLKEQGIDISVQLGEIFAEKARRGQRQRR